MRANNLKNINFNIKNKFENLDITNDDNNVKIINLETNSNIMNNNINILFENISNLDKVIETNSSNIGLFDYNIYSNILPNILSNTNGLEWDNVNNKIINTITQYNDNDVENILSNSNYFNINNIPLDSDTLHINNNKIEVIKNNLLNTNNSGKNIVITEENDIKKINVGSEHTDRYITIAKVYNFTNNEQVFIVPSETNEVLAYVWGAGGGGGGYINGGCGGSGGFSSAIINVRDINKLYYTCGWWW